jgi:hypothetical protein
MHKLGQHLRMVHAHDNHGNGDEHLAPGTGDIDWNRVLSELDPTNLEGPSFRMCFCLFSDYNFPELAAADYLDVMHCMRLANAVHPLPNRPSTGRRRIRVGSILVDGTATVA